MTLWQIAQQVKYRAINHVWEGSSTKVFPAGSVVVTEAPPVALVENLTFPFLAIATRAATADPKHDELYQLLDEEIFATLGVAIPGDAIGEDPLLGRNRKSQTDSEGRGLFEVEEEVLRCLGTVSEQDGIQILLRHKGMPAPEVHPDHGYIVLRPYRFQALATTSKRTYRDAARFKASEAGGTVSLTWKLPPDRFDRLRLKLRRAEGSTPPSGPDDGDEVALGSDLAMSATDAPGVGTWSYALFGAYSETGAKDGGGDPVEEKYSAGRTLQVEIE